MLTPNAIEQPIERGTWASVAIAGLCVMALAIGESPAWADEVEGRKVVVPTDSAAASDAGSDTTPEPSEDDWQFEIAPYGWFIFIEGTTTFDNMMSDVSIGFDDIWQQLHMAVMLDTDIRKKDIGFLSDLVYAYLWQRTEQGPLTLESKIRLVIFDFAIYYEALKLDLGSGASAARLRLQPFVGGRYLYLAVPTTVEPLGAPLDPTTNTAVPILGLRAFLDINDNWNVSFTGDGGGFGVDGMDVTWQAELLGGYRFHLTKLDFNLMVGYKGLGLDHTGRELDTDFIIHGPVLKLGFEF